jgi:tetratricopeptide (TPR) repeat protein
MEVGSKICRSLGAAALAALFLAPFANAQPSKRTELERMVRANRLFEAEQQLWGVLQADPKQGWALDLLGSIRMRQQRDAEAEALFQRAFSLNQRDVGALRGLGDLARQRGTAQPSIDWYSKLLVIAPADVRARKALSILQEQTGEYQASADNAQRIPQASRTPDLLPVLAADYLAVHQESKVGPLISEVLRLRGESSVKLDFVAVLVRNGYLQEADKLLTAIRPASPDADYLHMVARMREAQGRNDESWQLLQRALKLQPKSFDLLFDCARFAAQHDRWNDAVSFLQRADEVQPDQPEVLMKLTLALLKIHYREKAVIVARKLNEISPDDPNAQYILAFTLVDNEQWEMAEPLARKVVKARPTDAASQLLLGIACLQQGKMAEARDALDRSLAIDSNLQDAHYYSALIAERTGDMDTARNELEALAKAAPNHAGGEAELGILRLRAGDVQGARTALETAVKLAPEVSQTHYQLGLAYQQLGLREQAAAEMDQYQKLRGAEDRLRRREVGLSDPK